MTRVVPAIKISCSGGWLQWPTHHFVGSRAARVPRVSAARHGASELGVLQMTSAAMTSASAVGSSLNPTTTHASSSARHSFAVCRYKILTTGTGVTKYENS
jgi:hypothetical protein